MQKFNVDFDQSTLPQVAARFPVTGLVMAPKRHSDEDILKLLREIELHLAGGADVATACLFLATASSLTGL